MEDDKIIALYFARNERAVTETSAKYGKYCRKIAYNILSNLEDSQECVNDTLLATWNAIPPQKPIRLLSFIGRITRNIALDKFDYNTAGKRNREFDLILDELSECISTSSNVEEQYEEIELAKIISQFLEDIDLESRNIFIRRYWYSDSIKYISSNLSISNSKVKSNLFRTRNKLKQHLKKEGYQI